MLPRSKPNSKPTEPEGYQVRTDAALRRERIDRMAEENRQQLPAWYFLPPWEAERHLEGKQQRDLFPEAA